MTRSSVNTVIQKLFLVVAVIGMPLVSQSQTPSQSATQMFTLVPKERMSSETQDALIDRLRRVLSQISRSEPSHLSSSLRLADLLTERARTRFMQEIEANCKGCRGSNDDRREAIALYESARLRTARVQQGAILFQLAHLYQMGMTGADSNERTRSRRLFEEIVRPKSGYSQEIRLRAHEGLGDIAFRSNDPRQAIEHYRLAMQGPDTGSHGVMTLRIAWSLFHTNRLVEATSTLERLLASPTLLSRISSNGERSPDLPLQIDVARDLAIFYARRTIGPRQINSYERLIPTQEQKSLLLGFSEEADRVGQKVAAKQILQRYMQLKDLTQQERTDALVRLTQIRHDAGDSHGSLAEFEAAASALQKTRCESEEQCKALQASLRRYVTEIHKLHKVKPSAEVLRAYQIYSSTFARDTEMAILGAQVALERKDYRAATLLYRRASESLDAGKISQPKERTLFETALMGEVEAAELAKDVALRASAYNNYLQKWPNGPEVFSVRYQMAQLTYEQKQWTQASRQFAALALSALPAGAPGSQSLRQNQALQKKAADLALDALAVQKQDAEIEALARQFAERMSPAYRAEFLAIANRAATNQIAAVANAPDASERQLNRAIDLAMATNLASTTAREREIHFNNLMVLGERAKRDEIIHIALDGQMAIPGVSVAQREQLLARRVGLYENRLQFDKAYALARRLTRLGGSKSERELRLGTLADLAGQNPRSHYRQFLKLSPPNQATRMIRARLVELSTQPAQELISHLKHLGRDSRLVGELVLLSYAKQGPSPSVRRLVAQPSVRANPAAQLLAKHDFYTRAERLSERLAKSQLISSSDNQLTQSIKSRGRMLGEADRLMKDATRLGDFTASIMGLRLIERENHRFVQDLMGLPIPKGLSPSEQQKYQTLLSQQAAPYLRKAQAAESKLAEFWANQRPLQALAREYQAARREIRGVLQRELQILRDEAPRGQARETIEGLLALREPTQTELANARSAVASEPQSVIAIERLVSIERRIGHPMLVPVLERRLEQSRRQERPRLAQVSK